MQVTNNASSLKAVIQTELIKKSQDVVKNQISYILEKNMQNTKALEEAAKFTGTGNNLNIKA